jgi:hypothetical protein
MSHNLGLDREAMNDYEPFEISGIDDLMFEYERDRDLESELTPFIGLNDISLLN